MSEDDSVRRDRGGRKVRAESEPTVDPVEDVALIISAGMFHKEPSPELVREIAQEVVDYFKEENDG